LFGVFVGPPIFEIAVDVELAALIIEVVCEFMADDCAFCAIVDDVISRGIEEDGLEDARGEVDGVGLRIFVGVDGGRRHKPLGFVEWMADEGKLAMEFEGGGVLDVAWVAVADDDEGGVVDPRFYR